MRISVAEAHDGPPEEMPRVRKPPVGQGEKVVVQTPLLVLSDSPDLRSGLARISRDLACIAAGLPEFRVGILGRGGHGSRAVPVKQYCFPEQRGFGELDIQHAWTDFAGDREGVVLVVWDATRVHWLSRPHPEMGPLYQWLSQRPFKLWLYAPIDATGPGDRLTGVACDALSGFDRVLAYTEWGAGVIERSIGRPVDWIPHGINLDVFKPRDRKAARMAMGFSEKDKVVGMVAINQPRKDWGCAFAAIQQLRKSVRNLRFWIHTDVAQRSHAWDFRALMADFGIEDICTLTLSGSMNDEQLSYWYSGCDVTILPSNEGFGYTLVESMACGTPVLHSTYGGGTELVPQEWWVAPSDWRIQGIHNSLCPVFDPATWASTILHHELLTDRVSPQYARQQVEHLNWPNLQHLWKRWFLEGLC